MRRLAAICIAVLYIAACSGSIGTLQLGGSTAATGGGGGGSGGGGGGSGGGGSGSGLTITTTTINDCTVGVSCTQSLSASGGSGSGYVFSKVTEYPNTDLWDYVTPTGRAGTPQYAETENATYLVTDSAGNTNFKTFTYRTVATGALTILTPATPPTATVGGAYTLRLLASGGIPPYFWSSGLPSGAGSGTAPNPPCELTFQGWLMCAPTTAGSFPININLTDNNGSVVGKTITITANNALQLGQIDPVDSVIHLPSIIANNPLRAVMHAYGGTPPYTFSATGLPSWASINTSTGIISGTPTVSGNASFTVTVTDAVSATASSTAIVNVGLSSIAQRPAYNTGSGFFVLNGQLYDALGHLFHVRGTNHLHYNSGMQNYVPNTGVNMVRIWDGNCSTSTYLSLANSYIAAGIAVDIGMANIPTSTADNCATSGGTSGNNSTAALDAVTAWWVAHESAFAPIMNKMLLNLDNEWSTSAITMAAWESANASEITKLRTAGYTCPIVIDSWQQGEDAASILQYAATLEAVDPLHSVILGWHAYQTMDYQEARIASVTTGTTTKIILQSNAAAPPLPNYASSYYIYNALGMTQLNGFATGTTASGSPGLYSITLNLNSTAFSGTYVPNSATIVIDKASAASARGDMHYRRAADLFVSQQIPVILEELAGSQLDSNLGGSDGSVSTVSADWGQKVGAMESWGMIGYLNWDWDDNNLAGNKTAWGSAYGYTLSNPVYTGNPTQLTGHGLDFILNPRYGFDALGSPAAFLQ